MNVDRMLREITWEQFIEWRAFDDLDPIGDERADARSAHQAQVLVNLHRGKDRDPYPLSDFMLPFGDYVKPPPKQQDWRAMKFEMMQLSGALGTPAPPEVTLVPTDAVSDPADTSSDSSN